MEYDAVAFNAKTYSIRKKSNTRKTDKQSNKAIQELNEEIIEVDNNNDEGKALPHGTLS